MKIFALLFAVILFAACSKSGDDVKPVSSVPVTLKADWSITKDSVEVVIAKGQDILLFVDTIRRDSSFSVSANIGDTITVVGHNRNKNSLSNHAPVSLALFQNNNQLYSHTWYSGYNYAYTLVVK